MNQLVIDETLSGEVTESKLQIDFAKRQALKKSSLEENQTHWDAFKDFYESLATEVESNPAVTMSTRECYCDIIFAGTKKELGVMVRALRSRGLVPDNRPRKEDVSWTTWWRHMDRRNANYSKAFPKIWLSFHSTQCERVKVGTKMVPENIYEVKCGEGNLLEVIDDAPF